MFWPALQPQSFPKGSLAMSCPRSAGALGSAPAQIRASLLQLFSKGIQRVAVVHCHVELKGWVRGEVPFASLE